MKEVNNTIHYLIANKLDITFKQIHFDLSKTSECYLPSRNILFNARLFEPALL